MTRTDNVLYFLQSDGAHAYGRDPDLIVTGPATSRTNPTRGTYMPNSNQYSGLLPGWTPAMLTPVYPGGSGATTITAGGVYRNKLFWGQVKMQSTVLAQFENCLFAGFDASVLQTTDQGAIKCYGAGYYQWYAQDCLIDPAVWMDATVTRPGGAPPVPLDTWRECTRRNVGLHGGRGSMIRCEIKNVIDCVAPVAANEAGYESTFILLEDSWLHKNHYYRNYAVMPSLPEGTHSDGIQPALGQNMTFRGCYIGGTRDPVGYGPNYNAGGTGIINGDTTFGWNSGDDAWNNLVYWAQESPSKWNLPGYTLDYIVFEGCFFEGGVYAINHHYETTRPAPMTHSAVRDCFFVRKANSKYILRNPIYASLYTNNHVIDVNGSGGFTVAEAVPINNGT